MLSENPDLAVLVGFLSDQRVRCFHPARDPTVTNLSARDIHETSIVRGLTCMTSCCLEDEQRGKKTSGDMQQYASSARLQNVTQPEVFICHFFVQEWLELTVR
jgi:hypothetical protein